MMFNRIRKEVKQTIRFMLLVMLIALPNKSCDIAEILNFDCSQCYTTFPKYGNLEVSITINNEISQVPVTVYKGAFENDNVVESDIATTSSIYFFLETNVHYTLKAEYQKDGRKYNVINGAFLKTRRDTENCDEPCYYITGKKVDLKLYF